MDIEGAGREFQRGLSIGARAAALGHEGTVIQKGKRFFIECKCGEKSDARWNRKRQFQWIHDHCIAVVRSSETHDTPSSVHEGVGGRA